jgi:hypothetical protein
MCVIFQDALNLETRAIGMHKIGFGINLKRTNKLNTTTPHWLMSVSAFDYILFWPEVLKDIFITSLYLLPT